VGLEAKLPNGILLTNVERFVNWGRAGSLWPGDPVARAAADMWMDWQISRLMPDMTVIFWGLVRTPEDQRDYPAINAAAKRVENVEQGQPIRLNVVLEARRELDRPVFAIHVLNSDGATVFGFNITYADGQGQIGEGERVRLAGTIENPLLPGRYFMNCFIYREDRRMGALQAVHLPDFVVFGTKPAPGIVSVRTDVRAVAEGGGTE
jgi:hypothetical protein